MIICPKCKTSLKELSGNYKCVKCDYIALKKNNLIIFNPEIRPNFSNYNAKYLDELYRYEQKHFWFIARKKIILNAFKEFVPKNKSIIEIGAGTGDIMRSLAREGYSNISVGEIHISGLQYAQKYDIKNLYQFDVTKSPFKNHFDVVGAFDVLEHINDDNRALENIWQMLKKNGKLIITVPAMKWLWSDIDKQSGHVRRYNQVMVKELFTQNSFEIISIRGFFILVLPLLIIRSLLNKKNSKKNLGKRVGFEINGFTNLILAAIMSCEELFLKNAPGYLSGSLIVVARKKE